MVRSGRFRGLALLATLAALGGVLALAAGVGSGATEKAEGTTTLKIGYVTGAAHPYGQTMNQFVSLVNQASGGSLQIQPLPLYAGGDDVQLLNDIKGGAVDGGAVSTVVWTTAKINSFVALQMPFLIDNYALEQRVIGNSSGIAKRMLAQATTKAGLVGLGLFEGGMRQFALKSKDVNSVADLKGLKIRTPPGDPITSTIQALGASPTPIAIGQVFQSLQSGVVDGMEANTALVNTFRFDQAGIRHITIANLFPFPAAVVMSKASFDKLTPDQQAILRNAAKDLPAFSISVVSGQAFTNNAPNLACSRGVKFHQLPASARTAFIKAVRPVYTKWQKNKQVAAFISQIQKLKAKPAFRSGAPTDVPPPDCME
jgi:tripartite ATP-independent transporter DctP family solute receptor